MANYLGDSFYIIEYLGHINNGSTQAEDLLQKYAALVTLYEADIDKMNGKDKLEAQKIFSKYKANYKALSELKKLKESGEKNRQGVMSSLPGNIAVKLDSFTINESSSVTIPTADISFKGCDYDDLLEDWLFEPKHTWKWHDKGAGYRVWLGYVEEQDVSAKPIYKYDMIFEGYVIETVYNYEREGISVKLSLYSHTGAQFRTPIIDDVLTKSYTLWELFNNICDATKIPESKRIFMLGDTEKNLGLKTQICDLVGFDITTGLALQRGSDEYLNATLFYTNEVQPQIVKLQGMVGKSIDYINYEMLMNIITSSLKIKLRWHITCKGYIFLGYPFNPKTVDKNWALSGSIYDKGWRNKPSTGNKAFPPKKVFVYRPYYITNQKSFDYLDQQLWSSGSKKAIGYSDFFEGITLGELDRGQLPIVPSKQIVEIESKGESGDTGGDPANQEVIATDKPTQITYYGVSMGGDAIKVNKGVSLSYKIYGLSDVDFTKLVGEAFALGHVSLTVSGCIPDPYVSILDTLQFIGHPKHSGRYLITAITYSYSQGAAPKVEYKGITPITPEDIQRMNSGAKVFEIAPPVIEKKEETDTQVEDVVATSQTEGNTYYGTSNVAGSSR